MEPIFASESASLRKSSRYLAAKRQLLEAILESSSKIQGIKDAASKGPSSALKDQYAAVIRDYAKNRGRDLYYPFLGSGLGSGPFVELLDGSVKYDMITGIGINFFGHSHPGLMEEVIDSVPADLMQGNLEPGVEMKDLLATLLSKVGDKSKLKHGWLTCSGTMANELALKMVRQKKFPATKIFAFKDCFAGRSTAMQEVTDNPSYRQGQPTYGEVHYLPFYDPNLGLEKSTQATLSILNEELNRYPGRFAAVMIELIQGEGGFRYAPREFYLRIFEQAKKAGLAVWVDEVQTFGRTGELFAYQKFDLAEFIDLATVAKLLQASAVLFTEEYNPKPGLVAGTFAGSTSALRSAKRIIETLSNGNFLGENGRITQLSNRFNDRFKKMSEGACRGMIREFRTIGGMIALAPFEGTMADVKTVLFRLYDLGVIAFYCGHGPHLIRLLPPLPVMSEQNIDEVCALIEKAILDVSKERLARDR